MPARPSPWRRLVASVLGLAAALVAEACAATPGLELSSVEPALVSAAAPTPVTLRGRGFVVRALADFNAARSRIDSRFTARLGGRRLEALRYVDTTMLLATVPAGLPPGEHDLVLTDPMGREALLAGAVRVEGATHDGGPSDGPPDDGPGPDAPPATDVIGGDVPPDLPGSCEPPRPLAPSVSGPLNILLSNIQIDGLGQVVELAAGTEFMLSADYSIDDTGCPSCRDQIVVGIAPDDPQDCIYAGSARAQGRGTARMTAPDLPGTYSIRFRYAQANGCEPETWWAVDGTPGPEADIAVICVR